MAIQPSDNTTSPQPKTNVWVRLLTGLIGIPIFMGAVIIGDWAMLAVAIALVTISSIEYYYMERNRGVQNNVVLGLLMSGGVLAAFLLENLSLLIGVLLIGASIAFIAEYWRCRHPQKSFLRTLTTMAGVFYVAFPGAMALTIRGDSLLGLQWFIAILGTTWSVDTFSFLAGKIFGKRLLLPRISPKKTVEGAIGGSLVGVLVPFILLNRAQLIQVDVVLFLLIAALSAVAGDLLESLIKRFFGVKDSSVPRFNLFPGHGGVLDRVDALLMVIVAYYIFLALTGRLALI